MTWNLLPFRLRIEKKDPLVEGLGVSDRALANALLGAIDLIRSTGTRLALIEALSTGDAQAAVDAIRWSEGEAFLEANIPRILRVPFETAGTDAARDLARTTAFRGAFNIVDAGAVDWIGSHSASLIREFGDSSRQAIRDLVGRAFEEGLTAEKLARLIRADGIGLTSRQARAVLNYRVRLERQTEIDRSDKTLNSMVDTYAKRLLRQRAEVISRTEVMAASNAGLQEGWRQAVAAGHIDPTRAVQEWQSVVDSRIDDVCLQLDGVLAKLGEPFRAEVDGELISTMGPPIHPACRCRPVLLVDGPRRKPR